MPSSEHRRTELLRGVLDLCLLAVMQEGAAYGYEMTKRLRARGLSIVGEGSIYPLLGRLEREGLVETSGCLVVGEAGRRPVVTFASTAWLRQASATVTVSRDPSKRTTPSSPPSQR